MSRFPWVLLVVLLVGTILGAGWFLNNGKKTDGVPVKEDTIPSRIVCLGLVDSEKGVARLYPTQPGRVIEVIEEGTTVTKGTALLKLDDRFAKFKKKQAESDLKSAQELLNQAKLLPEKHANDIKGQKATIKAAQAHRESIYFDLEAKKATLGTTDLGKNTISMMKETLNRLDAAVEGEQTKLASLKLVDPRQDILRAEAGVEEKQAVLDLAQLAVEECVLRAPHDGTVLQVHVHVGDVLGQNAMGPAIQFASASATGQVTKIVRAEVMQEWARDIREDQPVIVEDDTQHRKGEAWQGTVQKIGQWIAPKRYKILEPFMVNDVRTLECVIKITSEGPSPLLIGQRVRVTINTDKK